MPESEFVTISRASQLLEAPERTVRRMADKLADTDRQLAAKGGRLVRLVALAALMGKPLPVPSVADRPEEVADTGEASGRHVADKEKPLADTSGAVADSGGHSQEALVEQLRSEVAFLRSALEREQGTTQALAARLEDSDKRLAAVLAGTGRLRIEPSGLAGGDSGVPEGSPKDSPALGFWARLWRRNE